MTTDISDEVARLCNKHFKLLPKKGKPHLKKEWTLLAAVVLGDDCPKPTLKVVSLSTGTKCLGYSQLSEKGDMIFDSHAEVLARRGLIRFLFHQMHLLLQNQNSSVLTFDKNNCKFSLKPGIKFHLFISHVPCGDAAIFPKISKDDDRNSEDGERKPKRLKKEADSSTDDWDSSVGEIATFSDIHRTGAKCVNDEIQDSKEPGVNFHVIGVLRTKPGRGDPTWSMSCSDKIALWNVCGLQGALLSNLLTQPIYLSSLIFGKCPFDLKAVQRAVIDRLSQVTNLPPHFHLNKPSIYLSSVMFEYSKENMMKENSKVVPCPASIIWCDASGNLEVCVNGKKQGITKKNFDKPSSRINVCKSILLERFLEICSLLPNGETKIGITKDDLTYLDYKLMAKPYQDAKAAVLKIFDNWKRKPDNLQVFCLSKSLE